MGQFDAFVAEAWFLKAKYADQISLLVGLETEHITAGDLDHLEALLSRYPGRIQYVVGSVHHAGEVPIDFDEQTFEKALAGFTPSDGAGGDDDDDARRTQMDAFLCAYLDAQLEVLTRFRPEVVGHVDLCRLYRPTLRFGEHPAAHARLKRNIAFAVEYGALFELNAAALRKGWTAAYPGEDVVEACARSPAAESTVLMCFFSPPAHPGGRWAVCAVRRQPRPPRCGAELRPTVRVRAAGGDHGAVRAGGERRTEQRRSPRRGPSSVGELVGTSVLDTARVAGVSRTYVRRARIHPCRCLFRPRRAPRHLRHWLFRTAGRAIVPAAMG